jgi:hypothetical protein
MSDKKDTLDDYYKYMLHNEPEQYVEDFINRNSERNKDQQEVYNRFSKLRQYLADKSELSEAIRGYNWDDSHDWNKGVPQYGNAGDKKANEQIRTNPEIGSLVNDMRSRVDFEDILPTSGKEFPENADGLFTEYPSRQSDIEYAKMIRDQRKMTKDYNIPESLAPLNSLGHDETVTDQSSKRFNQLIESLKKPIK